MTALTVMLTLTRTSISLLFCAVGLAQPAGFFGANYSASGTAATPTFSPGTGTYGGTQSVTISTATAGATICYVTSGTPSATVPGTCDGGSITYGSPVSVSASETLSALATKIGLTNSSVGSASYVINATPTAIRGTPTGNDGNNVSSLSTAAATTTATDTITYGASLGMVCAPTGASTLTDFPTDTGGDSFTPIFPGGPAYPIGVHIASGGSSYTGATGCSISGSPAGASTCSVTLGSGGTAGQVVGVQIGVNSTPFTGAGTVSITDSGGGSGANVVVSGYGTQNANTCQAIWYAKNIAATTNNQVSLPLGGSTAFVSAVQMEIQGADTSAPLDQVVSGSGTGSVTTGSFGSGLAHEFVACFGNVYQLSQTWTAGSGFTLALGTGGTPNYTIGNGQYQADYNPNGTSPSISVTSGSNAMQMLCASFKN
jgi:hypothetical protein